MQVELEGQQIETCFCEHHAQDDRRPVEGRLSRQGSECDAHSDHIEHQHRQVPDGDQHEQGAVLVGVAGPVSGCSLR